MVFRPHGNNDPGDCARIIHRALDAGINVIDTVDVYSGGVSEEIVGRALASRRDEVIVATRVNGCGGHRADRRRSHRVGTPAASTDYRG